MGNFKYNIPKLIGSKNYNIWAIKIKSILLEKELNYPVFNNIEELNIDQEAYKDIALKATSLIRLSLEDGPLLQTATIENPYKLWLNLENLYKAKGFSSEFLISKELINININSYKGNLEEYINNFIRLNNELLSKEIKLPTKFLVSLLLNNLNKDFEFIVANITQLIRSNSEINLDQIINQLLDEYRRVKSLKNNKAYNYSYISNNYRDSSKNNFNYSKNSSKEIEMGLNTSNNTSNKNLSNIDRYKKSKKYCSFCKKTNHLEANCYYKKNQLINNSNLDNNSNSNTILSTTQARINNKIDFILDSGATVHTCYIKDLFNSIKLSSSTIK
jgi:hypothetical protein